MSKRGGGGFGGMPGNMNNLMKQAQRMQELAEKEFSATAGGGAVEAIVKGDHKLVSLKVSQEAVDPDDVETLQDLVVAAVNEAMGKAEEAAAKSMPGLF